MELKSQWNTTQLLEWLKCKKKKKKEKKKKKKEMVVDNTKCWQRCGTTGISTGLEVIQNGTTTLESTVAISYKMNRLMTIWLAMVLRNNIIAKN